MDFTAFILFIFGLQAICLFVGAKSSKRLENQEDYFLAGKGIRFFPLMMTFIATQVGGGIILGSAEEAYRFGWSILFYPLGASLGLSILGLGIGKRLAKLPVSTIAQIFEVVYKSAKLKKIASFLSMLSLFMIFVGQIIASNKFMVSLGLENPIWFIAFWAIVIFYTAFGGLKAVVATDIVQASFFIIAFILCFGYASYSSDMTLPQIFSAGLNNENFAFEPSKLCGWLILPLLFMVIEQDMGQRCFAAESPKTVSKAALWAAIFTLIMSIIPVFFGVYAKNLGLDIPEGASVFMTVIKETTTPILTALVGCAILAAIISTADSLINAIGSNLAQDFEISFLKKDKLYISQGISALIAVSGLIFSFYFNNIVDILIQSYELSVSCLFIPIAIALFKKQGNKISATLSIAFGFLSFAYFKLIPSELPREIITILVSLTGYILGEILVMDKTFYFLNQLKGLRLKKKFPQ